VKAQREREKKNSRDERVSRLGRTSKDIPAKKENQGTKPKAGGGNRFEGNLKHMTTGAESMPTTRGRNARRREKIEQREKSGEHEVRSRLVRTRKVASTVRSGENSRNVRSRGSDRRRALVDSLRDKKGPRPKRVEKASQRARGTAVRRVGESIRAMAGEGELGEIEMKAISELVQKAYDFNAHEMGVEAALNWAEGFKIDPRMVKEASEELVALEGHIEILARQRQTAPGRMEDRINPERLLTLGLDEDDEDMVRMRGILESGIEVPIKEGFKHQSEPPPLRKSYLEVAPAVEKVIAESVSLGNAIIVDEAATKTIKGLNFSALSWIPQPGPPPKPAGRTLVDSSHPVGGADALNTEEVKEGIIAVMGDIVHPTIVKIARAICALAERVGWENVRLFKMDIKGAFTLLDFKPADIRLLAVGLTGGRTYFPLAGVFGLTIMPFVFNVATRLLSKAINKRIWGVLMIYVDDLMGITHVDHLESDMRIAHDTVTGLFGPGSVADIKTESGRRITLIGWDIDASKEAQDFAMSEKNLLKAIFAFFEIDIEGYVSVKQMQTIASLASRYALVCPEMKPYTGYLYEAMQGKHDAAIITLKPEATACIARFRAFLCQLVLEPERYRRKLEDLTTKTPECVIEFDASLVGIGIKIGELSGLGNANESLIMVAGIVTPFDLEGDSSFQNTMEFIAVIMALGLLASKGIRNIRFRLRGDSRTALAWSHKQRFKPGPSEAAAVAFILFAQEYGLRMGEEEEDLQFILGIVNVACDDLSRGRSPTELGYDQEIIQSIKEGDRLWELLELCHPLRRATTETETGVLYRRLRSCIRAL